VSLGRGWQIIPARYYELMSDPDKERSGRAIQAMMGMKKLIVADLEAAAEGK
jgi:predicted 3-demethylubiquinone-9 3-methyltransferase (glyoxalase superfamily)